MNYTYSNYIPTLLRTILGRRYDISHEDASNLLDIIIAILPMVTTKIGSNEVSTTLSLSFIPSVLDIDVLHL